MDTSKLLEKNKKIYLLLNINQIVQLLIYRRLLIHIFTNEFRTTVHLQKIVDIYIYIQMNVHLQKMINCLYIYIQIK